MHRTFVYVPILGLALLPALAPSPALANEEDRGFLTGLLEDNLSGAGREVRIEGFQGALSSRARLDKMTIADSEGVWLTLTDVTLDWSRAALLTGRVKVDALTAAHIDLARLPVNDAIDVPEPTATPFSLPELPVSIQIGQLAAEKITLGESVIGTAITAKLQGGANLDGGEGNAKFTLERIDGTKGILSLEGGFINTSRMARIDLALQEDPGGIAASLIGLPGEPALDLTIQGEAPIDDFTAKVALRSDGQDRLAGQVRLSAQEGAQVFALDLGGDVTPLFLPDYAEFFGPDVALIANGRQEADGALSLEKLSLRSAALSVEGQANIAADGLPQKLDLLLDLKSADQDPVLLPLAGDPVRVAAANLKLAYDAAVSGDGWRLSGHVDQLDTVPAQIRRLQLNGEGIIARNAGGNQQVEGEVSFTGADIQPADPALAEALGKDIEGFTRFDWATGAPLRLRDLRLTGQGYAANGDVTVKNPSADLTIEAQLNATVESLTQFSGLAGQDLAGRGVVTAQGSYTPLSGAFDIRGAVRGQDLKVSQPEADALLRGESLIDLDAARTAEGTHLRKLEVAAQNLKLTAAGWVRPTGPDVTANFTFSDLAILGAGRSGAFSAKADLKGTSFDNDITLTLSGRAEDLRLGIAQADGFLKGTVAIDGAAHLIDEVVTLRSLKVAGSDWTAEASGLLSQTLRDLEARFDIASLSAAGAGFGGALKGNLGYSLIDGVERLSADATANNLAVGQAEANQLLRGTTTLSAKALHQDGIYRVEAFNLQNPQLSATATANQQGDQRRVDINARLVDMALLVPGVPGALTLGGQINEQGGDLRVDLDAQGPGGINIAIDGTMPLNFSSANLTVAGSADAALANAFLSGVAVRGPLQINLGLNGPLGLSALNGTVRLDGGRLTLANPPMAFSGVSGNAAFGAGRVNLDLAANNDAGGRVVINGPVTLSAPFNGDLRVALQQMVLRDPQLYQTQANGALSISGPLTGGARIQGQIDLDETELRIPSSGLGGLAAIPDLRHVREPAAVQRTRARAGLLGGASSGAGGSGAGAAYPIDVTINAPSRVFIRGRGLDAELGGSFRITGTTANITPSGGLELIRGRLDLLGKRFEFTEGLLQMEGDLVPTIRLVASTETVDGTANVIINGRADAPVISFTSNPELPEEEVVARLLFGRGLTTLTPLQAAQLASAVATLTGKGGGVVDRLRQNFGLDDFDISTSEGGGAAVKAGKYLSENVYVDLKLDSDGKSEVSINLDVSKSVTIRGRAGTDGDTGVGIHFERDY